MKPSPRLSSGNSSTTALNNGQTFTGAWEDVISFDSLTVAVATDQNGVLTIEYSPDASNVDSTLTRYYNTSLINPPHRFTNTRGYVRVKFENNSGSNQTYFRLQTLYGDKTQLNIPLDATMSQNYDAWATRPTSFEDEVGLSLRQGVTNWNKWGYNDDIDTGTDPEVLAAFGGMYTPPTNVISITDGQVFYVTVETSADNTSASGRLSLTLYKDIDG